MKINIRKYRLVRRFIELIVLLILLSPAFGLTFFTGSLIGSTLLGVPLTDPLAFFEYLFASKSIYLVSGLGVIIVLGFYFLLRGRTFCSYICPIHLISEVNGKLHNRFKIKSIVLPLEIKFWVLGLTLFLSFIFSLPFFTSISPIGIISRFFSNILAINSNGINDGIYFLFDISIIVLIVVSMIEIFFVKNVWCRNICPVGGFYALLGKQSLMKVKIDHDKCVQCEDCFSECMVDEVLEDPVFNDTDFVLNGNCSNCFNCIEVCPEKALKISLNFNKENKNVA